MVRDRFKLLKILGLDDHVVTFLIFVALYQIRSFHETKLGVIGLHLNSVVRFFVQAVQGDPICPARSVVNTYRTRNEGQLQVPLPTSTWRHGFYSPGLYQLVSIPQSELLFHLSRDHSCRFVNLRPRIDFPFAQDCRCGGVVILVRIFYIR